jgi:predicted nuclease with RNAse H fold
MPKIIGIDLAGKETNPTGFCVLTEDASGIKTDVKVFYYDKDIIEGVKKENPDLIAIDAPFGFPEEGYFRESDKLLMEMGFKPLSPKFPNMGILVNRARNLIRSLEGYIIIEVFPQATKKILGIEKERGVSKDKFDAMLCALTGKYYLEGKYEAVGPEKIIIPKL